MGKKKTRKKNTRQYLSVNELVKQIIGRLNQNKIPEIEVARSEGEIRGSLILQNNGNWVVTSNRRNTYTLNNPVTTVELLTKFARLEDAGFHSFVGRSDLFDPQDEMYDRNSAKYVEDHYQELLNKFIMRLISILTEKF